MIYFIEAVGAGLVKIGFTERSPQERLKDLQTGCPHTLRVAAMMPGGRDEEQWQHGRWGYLWENGEWFRIDDCLRWYLFWLNAGREDAERLARDIAAALFAPAAAGADVDRLEEKVEWLQREVRRLRLSPPVPATQPPPVQITDRIRRAVLEEFRSVTEIEEFMESDRGH